MEQTKQLRIASVFIIFVVSLAGVSEDTHDETERKSGTPAKSVRTEEGTASEHHYNHNLILDCLKEDWVAPTIETSPVKDPFAAYILVISIASSHSIIKCKYSA
jgi:hypothetical protein